MEDDTAELIEPTAAPAPPVAADALPYPADGEEALHYTGTETITRGGYTFAPDAVVNVPFAVVAQLAGRDNIRVVAETRETWPNFLAVRARALASRPSN